MKTLVFASFNQHKTYEYQDLFGDFAKILPLSEFSGANSTAETGSTFFENAQLKSEYAFRLTGIPSFSDDSGLVIEALDGRPGIHSARYSQEGTAAANIQKVLKEMVDISNRKAYFIAVIAYTDSTGTHFFEGRVEGSITNEPKGNKGFGYDPIFIPEGYNLTFAELGEEIKNQISHRKKAFTLFFEYLKNFFAD